MRNNDRPEIVVLPDNEKLMRLFYQIILKKEYLLFWELYHSEVKK
jgi:hypothetical protein